MNYFMDGIDSVMTPTALLLLVLGVSWGTIVGALPGLGLLIAITMVLPFTYSMDVSNSLILIVGTAAGAQFGNGLTAITLGVPGSPSAVLTVVEGHALFKRGHGGEALFLNLIAAFFGQVAGALGFVLFVVPLAALAPHFLSPEMFAMTVLGLLAVASVSGKDPLKGLVAVLLGIAIASVGLDPISSVPRLTFGSQEVYTGLGIVPVTIGLLGLGEFFYQLHTGVFGIPHKHTNSGNWKRATPRRRAPGLSGTATTARAATSGQKSIGRISVPLRSLTFYLPVLLFGTVVAFLIGVIPGLGATAASFIVYQQLKSVARRPHELGKGSREGLVAQNAADNAVVGGELVPTLGLGLPGSGSMTVLMGALIIQGIEPGPALLQNRPELTGTVAAGFFLAGVVLLPLGWLFSYYASQFTKVWPPIIASAGILLILLGALTVRAWVFDVYAVIAFGVLGYLMRLFKYPVAAVAIGFVLGGLLETHFRRGMLIADGSWVEFVTRPLTGALLLLGLGILGHQLWWEHRTLRNRMAAAHAESLSDTRR
jgi:putative tricarboxylic transport membrane protein